MSYNYDLIVIGAGSGGISAANLALGLGKKVALVEKKQIGGDCTWYGCVPSKALIKASEVAHKIKSAGRYGLTLDDSSLDTQNVMAHVRAIRESVYEGEKPEVFADMGIDVIIGSPRFVNNHEIQIDEKTVSSKSFLISTGSSPYKPPVEGLDTVPYLTNETLFDLESLPKSLAVLGGGPIGTEMASALNRLGVKVTIIEKGKHILSREDPELVEILTKRLIEEDVSILTSTEAIKFAGNGDGINITVKTSAGETSVISVDSTLVSVGRRPNVSGLGLENAGVEYSPRGIKVNDKLQTAAGNIYAIGDVIGSYQFSHIAEYHANIAVPNAVLPIPFKKKVDYSNVVWATFTDPEFAHSGLTEAQAKEKYGENIRIYRHEYSKVDRAKTDLAQIGMSKIITDKKGRLVGMHIIGERAAALLHEVQLAKSMGIPFHKIQSMIHIYPTYGDMLKRPSVKAYVDKLQNNFFIKLAKKLTGK